MNPITDALNWIFPTWWMLGIWLGALAIAFIYHFLANNQTFQNKQNNARKYAIVIAFVMGVSVVAQIIADEGERIGHPVIIGFFGWIILEIADWSSYACHLWPRHPGGFQGWIWRNVIDLLTVLLAGAKRHYENTIDPAEIQIAAARREFQRTDTTPKRKTTKKG